MFPISKKSIINMAVSELTALGCFTLVTLTLTAPPPFNFILCQKKVLPQQKNQLI